MFRAAAIPVCLTVLAAFCGAPFEHFHAHDYTEHVNRDHGATSGTRHGHFGIGAEPGQEPNLDSHAEGGDEDAILLDWFQNIPNPPPALVFENVEVPVLPLPAPMPSRVDLPACRSHDPPALQSLKTRAPPCLSVPRGVLSSAV